jgi:hypothetical protein
MNPKDYIRASDGNGEAVRSIVSEHREIGDMSLIVDSVLNWPHKFIATSGFIDIDTGLLDPETMCIFYGHLDGTIIMIDGFAPGYSDVGHTAGESLLLKPTTPWADAVAEAIDEGGGGGGGGSPTIWDEELIGVVNGSNKIFATAHAFGAISVMWNGQVLHVGDDFNITGPDQITMLVAPTAGIMTANYIRSSEPAAVIDGTVSFISKQRPVGAINGSNTSFSTLQSYVGGSLEVLVNGLAQGFFITETNPNTGTFTLSTAPLADDDVFVRYQHSSGTVGNAQSLGGYGLSAVLEAIYPVGSVFVSGSDTMPVLIESIGTWVRLKGRMIIGLDEAQAEFDTINETGGTISHTHPLSNNGQAKIDMSGSTPFVRMHAATTAAYATSLHLTSTTTVVAASISNVTRGTGLAGNTDSGNNVPPYKTKYMWERIV